MKKFFDLFFETISFLTILPVKKTSQNLGYKMFIFFPFVGLVIGVICFCLCILLKKIFSVEISAFLVLFFYILLSDYLHLDGFVDTVDALFSCLKKNYIDTLKDPHIGVVGGIYLFMVLLMKYFLFLENNKVVYILTPVFSKTGLVIVGFFGRKLTDGIGEKFLHKNFFIAIFCLLFCSVLFLFILQNFLYSLIFVLLCFLSSFIITSFFNIKFGGINGDVFGFANEALEILFLTLFRFC